MIHCVGVLDLLPVRLQILSESVQEMYSIKGKGQVINLAFAFELKSASDNDGVESLALVCVAVVTQRLLLVTRSHKWTKKLLDQDPTSTGAQTTAWRLEPIAEAM